jgi:hypothetical protein
MYKLEGYRGVTDLRLFSGALRIFQNLALQIQTIALCSPQYLYLSPRHL